MKGLQLLATGGALPGRVVTNEDLSRQVDTSDEWIMTRTGIRQRYYCTESEDAATLAIAAARQALARSGLAASEIACCVAATLSAPTATPSVACRVQAALGLPENRPAFDVNAACSGFIYAIAAAHGLLNTLGGRYALVIGCEALSRMVDPTDRTTCVLFGDGAGAAILELAEDVPFAVTLGARGSEAIRVGGPAACDTAPITMDGKAVFRFAVETMPRCLQTVLERSQKTWIGSSAIRPIAALLTIVSNTCTQNRQNFIKIWTAMEIPVLPAFPLPCMKWWKMIYCTPARPWPASVLAAG
mgnify:CR=1 FL=1